LSHANASGFLTAMAAVFDPWWKIHDGFHAKYIIVNYDM
jgi:hypothetical protein